MVEALALPHVSTHGLQMKVLIATNDPVHGSELAEQLAHCGHPVRRAWHAGEAIILAGRERPSLAIIDRCHGDDSEAPRLAHQLLTLRIDVLWLGHGLEMTSMPTGALAAVLAPPCDPARVTAAVDAIALRRARPDSPINVSGLTIRS